MPRTKQPEELPYPEFRQRILKSAAARYGFTAPDSSTQPWGVIMETGYATGTFLLFALGNGKASVRFSDGGASTDGEGSEAIREAAQAMVALAAEFQPLATMVRNFAPPKSGQSVFYLLTTSGVFSVRALDDDLEEHRHAWSPLFYAGHEVINQYRLLEKGA
ncbi:MAG: hypothetical protein ABI615_09930 [Chthoniobacterales bacterium]